MSAMLMTVAASKMYVGQDIETVDQLLVIFTETMHGALRAKLALTFAICGACIVAAIVVSLCGSWALEEAMGREITSLPTSEVRQCCGGVLQRISWNVRHRPTFYAAFISTCGAAWVLTIFTPTFAVDLTGDSWPRMVWTQFINGLLMPPTIFSLWYLSAYTLPEQYRLGPCLKWSLFLVFGICSAFCFISIPFAIEDQILTALSLMWILDFQIDDIVRPANLIGTEGRLRRTKAAVQADIDGDGLLSVDTSHAFDLSFVPLEADDAKQLAKDRICVALLQYFFGTDLKILRMLESLKLPVLVSGVGSDAELSSYLARYTTQPIVLAVGGGNYDIARGIFNESLYEKYNGGMLEAFGKLFAGNARIFQYPNIGADGAVSSEVDISGSKADLHRYLVGEKQIAAIEPRFMDTFAMSEDSNEPYRGQSEDRQLLKTDVVRLMKEGSSEWENYVPDEAAGIIKKSSWFQRYTDGGASSQEVIYKVFEVLDKAPMVRLVESIELGPEALVRLSIPDGQAPGSLPEGCYVEFSDVQGCDPRLIWNSDPGAMRHLKEVSPCGEKVTAWKISSKSDDPVNSIRIGNTSGFPAYVSGGMVTEKKVGVPYPFKSLAETLKDSIADVKRRLCHV
eukprot:s1622_g11.t1